MSGSDRGHGEGAGEIRLANSGRPDDEDLLMGGHPAARGEIEQHAAVEPGWPGSRCPRSRPRPELCRAEVALQSPVLPFGRLPVDEEAEAILEARRSIGGGLFALFGKGVGHPGEVERVELVDRRVGQHREFSFHS